MAEPLRQKLKVEPDGVESTFAGLRGAVGGFSSKVEGAGGKVDGLLGRIKTLATSGKAFLIGTLAAGVAAVTAAIGKATAEAVEFENQLNEARKTADLTERQFNDLREELLGISGELGVAQQDLAGIASEAGRLGIEGTDDISQFVRTVALMSEATVATADQAAQGLARALNAFDLSVDKAQNFASVLNSLSNQTVATSADLIDLSTRIGAAGNQLGIAAEDAAALGATLVDAGFRTEKAGTRMRFIFTRIMSRSEEVGEVMDMTGQQVIQSFEKEGVGALQAFLDKLGEMGQTDQAETIADIFGQRDIQTLQTLIQNTDEITANLGTARDQMDRATSLAREFSITMQDVANEWGRLTGKLSAWVTDFGSNFTGVLEESLSMLNDMLGGVDELTRDLNALRRRRGELGDVQALARQVQEAERGTAEFEQKLGELANAVPDAFLRFNEMGEVVGVRFEELNAHLEEMGENLDEEVGDKTNTVIAKLNDSFQALRRAQERVELFEPGTDRWEEAREAVQENRKEVNQLVGSIEKDLPEGAEEARSALEELIRGADFATTVGPSLRDDSVQRDIFGRVMQARRSGQGESEGDSSGGGGEGDNFDAQAASEAQRQLAEAVQQVNRMQRKRNSLTDEEAQKMGEIFKTKDRIEDLTTKMRGLEAKLAGSTGARREEYEELVQQARRALEDERTRLSVLQEELSTIREIPEARQVEAAPPGADLADLLPGQVSGAEGATALERVNRITADYRDTVRDLRLELESGERTQQDFEEAATEAAEEAQKKLKELLEVLVNAGALTEELKDQMLEAFEATGDGAGDASDSLEDVQERLNQIAASAEGLSRIGEELGIIGEETASAIQGISQLAQGASSAVAGFSSGNIAQGISGSIQAIGGAIQAGSSIFGGDDGPDLEKLQREIEENTREIVENTQGLLEQGQVGEDISEQELAQAQALLEEIQTSPFSGGDIIDQLEQIGEIEDLPDLSGQFEPLREFIASEFDVDNPDELAAQLLTGDISFEEFGELTGTAGLGEAVIEDFLGEDFRPLQDILAELEDGLGTFSDSLSGVIDELGFLRSFGDTGAQDNFQNFIDSLLDLDEVSGDLRDRLEEVANLDVSTEEGRSRLQEIITAIATGLQSGELALGGLSASEVEELLDSLQSFAEEGGSGASDTPERRRQTQIQRTITEIQANELIAIETEQLFALRGILQALGGDVETTAFEPMGIGGPVALEVDDAIREIRDSVVQAAQQGGGSGGESGGSGGDGSPGGPALPPDIPTPTLPSPGERPVRDREMRVQVDIQAQETAESISEKIDEALRQSKLSRLGG